MYICLIVSNWFSFIFYHLDGGGLVVESVELWVGLLVRDAEKFGEKRGCIPETKKNYPESQVNYEHIYIIQGVH